MIPDQNKRPELSGAGTEACLLLILPKSPGCQTGAVRARNRTIRRQTGNRLHRKNIPYPPALRHARPVPRRWTYG